jgi:hypothetical protein
MKIIYITAIGIIFFTQLQNVSSFENPDNIISIHFLGDLNFGESYQTNQVYNRGSNIIEEYGYDYMFENIAGLLKTSDCIIANLETPLVDSIKPHASARKLYVHWSNSDKSTENLKKYGINVLSLGNNHSFDFGAEGLNQTISALQNNEIEFFGAGINLDEAEKPFVKTFINKNDTFTLAVLSGFEYRKTYDSIYNFYSGENKPGVNLISVERVKEQVKMLRKNYKNAYIIFFPHCGRNYLWKTEKQTETARSIIDTGVDLIIGHGAHMMQEIEFYNGHWIIYSIGNSVFNAPGRYESYNAKPYSFIAELRIRTSADDKEKHLMLYPVFTDNLVTDYQVRLLTPDEVYDGYSLLRKMSMDIKNFNDEFRIKETGLFNFFEIQLN